MDLMLFVMFLTMSLSVRVQLDILETQTILLWDASKWNVFQMMTARLTDSVMVRATSARVCIQVYYVSATSTAVSS